MKKLLSWFNKNRYNIVTLGLGGSYFWFLTFVHNVAEGDWGIFSKRPVLSSFDNSSGGFGYDVR